VLKEGDHVVFMTSKGGDEELCKLTGKIKSDIRDVMILGGGRIGSKTARGLTDGKFNIKLIEKEKNRAFDLADELPNTLVINGDGRNVELLEEENIQDMDAFISVTGNSETNIMSCLVAKSKGVKKTVALVENIDYFELSHSIGIDTIINKKLLAANNIFRYIRRGEVVAMTKLNSMDAELLEFIVKPTSKICNKLIKDLDFPRSAIIGGIIRNGIGITALGDFKVESGDRIVVCCLPQSIKKVESFFY
jgi:trk system potassium uptake protein TrkA